MGINPVRPVIQDQSDQKDSGPTNKTVVQVKAQQLQSQTKVNMLIKGLDDNLCII